MSMKPRLEDNTKKIDIGDAVTCANHCSGEEASANIANTVTTHKPKGNVSTFPNTVTHVNSKG